MRRALLAPLPVAAWFAPTSAMHVQALAKPFGITLRLDEITVTFDDGPHPIATPKVLELLREYDVKALFFLVGEQVRRTGSLRDEIEAAGHEIGLHGDTHRWLIKLPPRTLADDLDRGLQTVRPTTHWHRAPYGAYSLAAIPAVRKRNMKPLLWSRWGRDWRADATPAQVASDVSDNLAKGDVLLLHDADDYAVPGSWRVTVEALPRVLDAVCQSR